MIWIPSKRRIALPKRQFGFIINPYAASGGGSATYSGLNPADKAAASTLSNSNLTATNTTGGGATGGTRSVVSKASGKWYTEFVLTTFGGSGGLQQGFGVARANATLSNYLGQDPNAWMLWGNYVGSLRKYNNGSGIAFAGVPAFSSAVVGRVAVDLTAGKVWFGTNNSWSGNPAAGTGEAYSGITGNIFMACEPLQLNAAWTFRPDPAAHSYSAPAGFTAGWPD